MLGLYHDTVAVRRLRRALLTLVLPAALAGAEARAEEPSMPTPSSPAPSSPAPSSPAPSSPAPSSPAPSSPAPSSTMPTSNNTEASPSSAPGAGTVAENASTFGDPVPLTRREPTLRGGQLMAGMRYGLVGTGPTRFVDDIRLGITDTIELRTALYPWPASLTARARLGDQQGELGALIVEGGLAYFDAGIRLNEDAGEPQVGVRFHPEVMVGYARALGDRGAIHAFGHYRARLSFLPEDDQHAVAVDAHYTYDLIDNIAVSGGLGFASTIGTPVREVVVNFLETDRPGISHLLARDDGGAQSVTVPLTLTYGRVDSFDVDIFCTPRVFPEFGILFGAGLRFRIDVF